MRPGAVLAAGAGLILIGWAAAGGIAALGDARAAYRRARLAATPPRISAPPGAILVAPGAIAAGRRLEDRIANCASAAGLRLTVVPQPAGADGFVAARVGGRGGEEALRGFAAAIERGPPAARLARWSIRQQGAALRIDALVVAAWRRPDQPARGGIALPVAPAGPMAAPGAPALFALDTAGGPVAASADGPPELVGIAGRIAVDPQAIVRVAGGPTRILTPGQAIGAWRLVAIGADRARFAHAGIERTMVLPTSGEAAAPGR